MGLVVRGLCALLLVATACRPDTVELTYRLEEGRTLHFHMSAIASASWNIEQPGRGSYAISFDVTETVREASPTGAVLDVEMQPVEGDEQGLPSPGLEPRSFSLRIDEEGNVTEVLELNDIPAAELTNEELAFIGTYRPTLPSGPVGLGDEWRAPQEITVGSTLQRLDITGVLDSLNRDMEGRIATIDLGGAGTLRWTTELPQGGAFLVGPARIDASATFDIDGGYLRSASSTLTGDFDVRVVPGGAQAPISGTLQLELELTVRSTGEPS